MNVLVCPDPHRLAAFAHGELADDAARTIAEHVEHCPGCEETVRDCERRDEGTFAELLRAELPADEFLDEPQCRRTLASLRKLASTRTDAAPARPATGELSPGSTIRDYELLGPIGRGGMGLIYRARHTKLKRLVALKVLSTAGRDAASVARFEREMEAAGKVRHQNIVAATDAGEHEGRPFLVMEFVDGLDVAKLAERHGRLPLGAACEIIRQAAIGLDYAHRSGLIHRDVKPSNLMLTRERGAVVVKLLDLGLALLSETHSSASRELTSTGQVMGTIDYVAPEQVADCHGVDPRADLYALGATLYKLLAGVPVHHGPHCTNVLQKLHALANADPVPLEVLRPDLPAGLSELVRDLLAKNPTERPPTAAEVARRIAPFADAGALATLFANEATAVPSAEAIDARETSGHRATAARPHTWTARHNVVALLGAMLAAAALWIVLAPEGGLHWRSTAPPAWAQTNAPGQRGPADDPSLAIRIADSGVMHFEIRGTTDGVVWGTDVYSSDSDLDAAAVHAGLVRAGETAVIQATLLPGRTSYAGSVRNGVTSRDYGRWPQSVRLDRVTEPNPQGVVPWRSVRASIVSAPGIPGDVRTFLVTGTTEGFVWGTDVYTSDSDLATAAVHAGVLRPGETARVRVSFLPGRESYLGSPRNGITSLSWRRFAVSFRVERAGKLPGE